MRRSIDGMVVVITGASAGIGKALAQALHPRGAKLVLAARRLDRIESLNRELGGNHLAMQCDVSDRAQCESLDGLPDQGLALLPHGNVRPQAKVAAPQGAIQFLQPIEPPRRQDQLRPAPR